MTYSTFVFENDDGVVTIRLNDPDKLNALTFQTYSDLEKIFAELAGDDTVKVVVLAEPAKVFVPVAASTTSWPVAQDDWLIIASRVTTPTPRSSSGPSIY